MKALSSHWLGGSMWLPLWTQRTVISSAYWRFCSSWKQIQQVWKFRKMKSSDSHGQHNTAAIRFNTKPLKSATTDFLKQTNITLKYYHFLSWYVIAYLHIQQLHSNIIIYLDEWWAERRLKGSVKLRGTGEMVDNSPSLLTLRAPLTYK